MNNVAFLLTSQMRVHDPMMKAPVDKREFCPRCCGKFTEAEFESHDQTSCKTITELLGDILTENKPVMCPCGCGLVHPLDVELHRKLGCAAATSAGHGPFATGDELSMAD